MLAVCKLFYSDVPYLPMQLPVHSLSIKIIAPALVSFPCMLDR